jgi:hypothetical protein
MAKIHMLLQGKGGVGKSFIASTIAQYKRSLGQTPLCIDTDPVNATFTGFKALKVRRIELMTDEEINPRNFDALVELIAASEHDVVIDNGASSFVQLAHYLVTNQVPQLLHSMEHELIIHSVITGGQAFDDTLHNLVQIAPQFPIEATFVVWLNPYWGPIEHKGKSFEMLPEYERIKDRIAAIVSIPVFKAETYGRDLSEILQMRLTFDEALEKSATGIMTRQRLSIIRNQLYGQMAHARVI